MLRLPPAMAEVVRHMLGQDQELEGMRLVFKDTESVGLGPGSMAYGRVADFEFVDPRSKTRHVLDARLLDLPCIIEAAKTRDNQHYVKVGNVGQMICVTEKHMRDMPEIAREEAFVSPHGITPPAYNAIRRFRNCAITEKDRANMPRVEEEIQRVVDDMDANGETYEELELDEEELADLEREYRSDNGKWREIPLDADGNEPLRRAAQPAAAASAAAGSTDAGPQLQKKRPAFTIGGKSVKRRAQPPAAQHPVAVAPYGAAPQVGSCCNALAACPYARAGRELRMGVRRVLPHYTVGPPPAMAACHRATPLGTLRRTRRATVRVPTQRMPVCSLAARFEWRLHLWLTPHATIAACSAVGRRRWPLAGVLAGDVLLRRWRRRRRAWLAVSHDGCCRGRASSTCGGGWRGGGRVSPQGADRRGGGKGREWVNAWLAGGVTCFPGRC